MRLINATTLEFAEVDTAKNCKYAIVSHCWGDEEVYFHTFRTASGRSKSGWKKVEQACRLGSVQGYDWVWLDTCCIDGTSSTELSQTINSMFEWYQNAQECFVFLPDVTNIEDDEDFKRSRWFKRGWTLQELLAPAVESLSSQIAEVTGINARYLDRGSDRKDIYEASLAERMSWASERLTKRPEDIAYCLLGIFRVNMPLIYGEGATRAFIRLQLEIIKQSDDKSIFAWRNDPKNNEDHPGVLAQRPSVFDRRVIVTPLYTRRHPSHTFTSRGLELHATSSWLEAISDATEANVIDPIEKIVLLDCETYDPDPIRLAIVLRRSTTGTWYRHGCKRCDPEDKWSISPSQLSRIYVPQPELGQTGAKLARRAHESDFILSTTPLRWITEIATILATLSMLSHIPILVERSPLPLVREATQLIVWAVWSIMWSLTGYQKAFLAKTLAIGLIVAASYRMPLAGTTPVSDAYL